MEFGSCQAGYGAFVRDWYLHDQRPAGCEQGDSDTRQQYSFAFGVLEMLVFRGPSLRDFCHERLDGCAAGWVKFRRM
ncbi:hypothetical protein ACIQH9_21190 [Pseudarthrobacter oxydans]|uniref:hypothetical protein n=1 Tax=Pseudarthrobacter oxydans TaxID=1671 RepID=UPI0038144B54